MKDIIGYKLFRTAAGDPAVFGNGNGPLRDQLNVSPPRSWRQVHRKNVQRGCDLELPGLWFYFLQEPKASSTRLQASSPKHKGSSFKPQASSSKILAPLYMWTSLEDLGPRASAMIKVFCGCLIWKAIWCGENRILFPLQTFNSTVKKCPELL